jgi:hypothetical protein
VFEIRYSSVGSFLANTLSKPAVTATVATTLTTSAALMAHALACNTGK